MQQFTLFSTPLEGNFAALASKLATLHLKLLCKRLHDLAKPLRILDTTVLDSVLVSVEADEGSILYNSPEIGLVYKTIIASEVNSETWHTVVAQLVIGVFLASLRDQLSLDLFSNIPIFVGGHEVSPQHLKIRGDTKRLVIENVGGSVLLELLSHLDEPRPPLWMTSDKRSVPIKLGSASQILLAGQTSAWRLGGPRDHTPVERPGDYADQFEDALKYLEKANQEYYLWVVLILRQITPIHRIDEMTIGSASNFYLPGISQITVPATLSETIEMLVHECSHQYFNLAMKFGSMQTPDAPSYYSPLTKSERPLDRILIGYHAFGNVQLIYDALKRLVPEIVLPARYQTVQEGLKELSVILEKESNRNLTHLGRALYFPLQKRLAAES